MPAASASSSPCVRASPARDRLVAAPFSRASPAFSCTPPRGIEYGGFDGVRANPPVPLVSVAGGDYTRRAVTSQSAGSVRKLAAKVTAGAGRSRLTPHFRRDPPPFTSTLALGGGVLNATPHPHRTTSAAAQAPARTPLYRRLGWTNAGTVAALTSRLKAGVLA